MKLSKCFSQLNFRNKVHEGLTSSTDPISVSAPRNGNPGYPKNIDRSGLERVKFFWTPQQKMVMSDQGNTRLIIRGGPGVGKTLLLKNKVLEIADSTSEEKLSVLFIVGSLFRQSSKDFQMFVKKTTIERSINILF